VKLHVSTIKLDVDLILILSQFYFILTYNVKLDITSYVVNYYKIRGS